MVFLPTMAAVYLPSFHVYLWEIDFLNLLKTYLFLVKLIPVYISFHYMTSFPTFFFHLRILMGTLCASMKDSEKTIK